MHAETEEEGKRERERVPLADKRASIALTLGRIHVSVPTSELASDHYIDVHGYLSRRSAVPSGRHLDLLIELT